MALGLPELDASIHPEWGLEQGRPAQFDGPHDATMRA
jgi:hypothetical protein